MRRKRSVVLYTEDNGASLCWMESGTGQEMPYRLPCSCLLEVKDKNRSGRDNTENPSRVLRKAKVQIVWRKDPRFAKRKVTVMVCDIDPDMFTKGMLELIKQNVTLQDC
ncbi:unnamed protein product [Discosporangium mesarthrocarpum]